MNIAATLPPPYEAPPSYFQSQIYANVPEIIKKTQHIRVSMKNRGQTNHHILDKTSDTACQLLMYTKLNKMSKARIQESELRTLANSLYQQLKNTIYHKDVLAVQMTTKFLSYSIS